MTQVFIIWLQKNTQKKYNEIFTKSWMNILHNSSLELNLSNLMI